MDHVFGSKWLLNELNRLGFCIAPAEVTRYKQAVVEREDITEVTSIYILDSLPNGWQTMSTITFEV